jgi:hypothetical protein
MTGSTPNVLIILLAVTTYGSLTVLVMRFALRASRGPELSQPRHERPRAHAATDMPVRTAFATADREALGRVGPTFQVMAPSLPDGPTGRAGPRTE